MANFSTKLQSIRAGLKKTFEEYPQAFLLGGLVILALIASLANDAYIESLFKVTPIKLQEPERVEVQYMTVLDVTPPSGIKQSFDTFMDVDMVFSENLSDEVTVTSQPEHPLGFSVSGNKLRIFPKINWNYDQGYLLTITARSTNGRVLEEPYKYSMFLAIPPEDDVFSVH